MPRRQPPPALAQLVPLDRNPDRGRPNSPEPRAGPGSEDTARPPWDRNPDPHPHPPPFMDWASL